MRTDRYNQYPPEKKTGKLKILLVLVILLTAAAAGFAGYSYKTANDSLDISFAADPLKVEVGGTYKALDYVNSSVGKVTASARYLDADTVGDRKLVFTVSKSLFGGILHPEKEFTLNYSVIDTVPPLKLWSGSGTVLERGTEFDINNVIGYGDNADPDPEVKVTGKVNMEENGRYPLHIAVTDASGNKTEWDMYVDVADSIPSYSDDYPRTGFSDFMAQHKGKGKAFGIDVSTWQGDIDFKAVKEAGCDYVIIRIGYSDDGKIKIDNKFEQNYERAKNAGLLRGVYLYSYDNTEEDARASAQWISEMLADDRPELPIAFDWEDFGRFQTYKMNFATLNCMYDAFETELSDSGFESMLYSSKNYLEKIWENTDTRPVWLAHYTDKTDYTGPYRFWQASCTGRIDGIDGDVDMDIMY